MQQTNHKTSEYTQSKSRMLTLITDLLAKRGGYFANDFYAIEQKNNNVALIKQPNNMASKANWLILGRQHYFEVSKVYPIANKRELLKAIEYDDSNTPFTGTTLKFIERVNEHSHRVTLWVIEPEFLNSLNIKPWLVIPESFLLANALDNEISIASINTLTSTLFISKTSQGIVSGIKSANTPSIELFALASGAPFANGEVKQLTTEDHQAFIELLYQGLRKQSIASLQGFFIKSEKVNWKHYPWKEAGIICSAVFTSYLILTSGWLTLREAQLEYALTTNTEQVNESLALQKAYQTQLSRHQQLQVPLQQQIPHWNLWHVALDVIALESTLKSIVYKNETVTIQGWADKGNRATDILAKLTKNPYVLQPSFSKPVRKSRGREEFSISFSLNREQAVMSSAAEQTVTASVKEATTVAGKE
ncbi:PilN domain-containing protein [Thalassotalea sp. 1_MG-2023]|uniref:PilN domain-containing protein n=1 Tax=Thalassotalea sp. 1_MG-2023 TaxID=3062680 RepID=UPI0026E20F0F|nr:PilN domain-containing protein [Thalassotalea sp. 1_MG-2023]MDO6426500.1 PilN domain-containing protein [Thalassotalea sp. 1_MG-2023]